MTVHVNDLLEQAVDCWECGTERRVVDVVMSRDLTDPRIHRVVLSCGHESRRPVLEVEERDARVRAERATLLAARADEEAGGCRACAVGLGGPGHGAVCAA